MRYLLITLALLAACAPARRFDVNGNPLLSTTPVLDTAIGERRVAVTYCPLAGNLEKAAPRERAWKFAIYEPSYFFTVSKDSVVVKRAVLLVKKQGKTGKWYYYVTDGKGNNALVVSALSGWLTEHRFMELFNKTSDSTYRLFSENDHPGVPGPKHTLYRVIPFARITADFRKNVLKQ